MIKIIFEKDASDFILDSFEKSIDEEGYIVEKNDIGQRVLTNNAEEIKIEEFAGIRKGSEIFIKSDLSSLIQLCDDLAARG